VSYPIGENYYQAYADAAAQQYGVPVPLFEWQIGQESSWNPYAQANGSSAYGIAQFTSGTANMFNINPANPYQSITAAAQYDSQLANANGGNWLDALTSYGTLNPSNWAGGTGSQGYQTALSGAQAALASVGQNLGVGAVLNPLGAAANIAGATVAGATGASDPVKAFEQWLSSSVPSIAIVVIGIILLIGAMLMFAKSMGLELPAAIPVPV
jgi:hypothetical protein